MLQVVRDFHLLGLVTLKSLRDFSKVKLCVNSLIQSFLHQKKTLQSEEGNQQFLIVESNFKVYAYTDSPLYQAILKLFMIEEF